MNQYYRNSIITGPAVPARQSLSGETFEDSLALGNTVALHTNPVSGRVSSGSFVVLCGTS